jgi:arylsulfatase A-like enzyme
MAQTKHPTPLRFGLRLSALLLIVGALACTPPTNQEPQSVILVTLDTFRPDSMGVYGRNPSLTPQMDAFARRGTVYLNAYSPIPITAPAHAALFYSLPPHLLGLYNNGQIFNKPDPSWASLAEIFQRKGFHTAAFVSLGVLDARFQLDSGFQEYWDETHPRRWYRTAAEVNAQVLPWLERYRDTPFFLWVHYSDPHDPYAPPTLPPDLKILHNGRITTEVCTQRRESLRLRFTLETGRNLIRFECLQPFPVERDDTRISLNDLEFHAPEGLSITFPSGSLLRRGESRVLAFRSHAEVIVQNPGPPRELLVTAQGNINLFPAEQQLGYRQEISYLDQEFGRLHAKLDALGLLEDSLIVLAGDHGEGLGEYLAPNQEAHFGHIHYLKSLYIKVPLIVYDPSTPPLSPPSMQVYDLVGLADVAPTLLHRMGWRRPAFYTGRPLPLTDRDKDRLLFEETYTPEAGQDRFGGHRDPWHLIFIPDENSFQLYHIGYDRWERQNSYSMFQEDPKVRELARQVVRQAQEIRNSKGEVTLDQASREMLKSLGYIR